MGKLLYPVMYVCTNFGGAQMPEVCAPVDWGDNWRGHTVVSECLLDIDREYWKFRDILEPDEFRVIYAMCIDRDSNLSKALLGAFDQIPAINTLP